MDSSAKPAAFLHKLSFRVCCVVRDIFEMGNSLLAICLTISGVNIYHQLQGPGWGLIILVTGGHFDFDSLHICLFSRRNG